MSSSFIAGLIPSLLRRGVPEYPIVAIVRSKELRSKYLLFVLLVFGFLISVSTAKPLYSQLIHRYPQRMHRKNKQLKLTFVRTLYCKAFQTIRCCGKNKSLKIWLSSGKKCYFVSINLKLTQTPDNDRLSRRIRGHLGRQGAVPSPGRVQKATAG